MSDAPSGGRPLLLCLSHLRWDFVFQRPQHLLTRAARGYQVVFFEEPLLANVPAPQLAVRETPEGVTVATPHVPAGMAPEALEAAQRQLLDGLLARRGGQKLVAWFYTPMALCHAGHLAPDLTVYDCMDELSAFRGAPPQMLARERELLRRAELVFTGGRSLFEAKRDKHRRVFCFPSSIDVAHFAAARRPQPDVPDQAGIARPRIGFFGVVDERMDIGLVEALATLRPEWQFVMVGPVVKIEEASLPRRANIHWLGGRKYAELPRHLSGWDAGFMPFALNESTRFISPTKTPEFLAAGLPLASTPVTDVVRDWGDGFVEVADSPGAMADSLAMLLERPRQPWLRRVDRRLSRLSWDRTWQAMDELMRQAMRPARAAATVGSAAHV